MKCKKCGTDTFLPFRCQYCGGYFCSDHRLPENHECPQMNRARMPREETRPITVQRQRSNEFTVSLPHVTQRIKHIYFSYKEIKHLSIGILLVAGVGLSLIGFQSSVFGDYALLAIYMAMFTTSFFMHEMAHKAVAQKYGLWAEFRLTLIGALLTLLSIVPSFIKIISPGAVMVAGSSNREIMGKTSVAGPVTNIIIATTLLGITPVIPAYASMLGLIAFFNGWIAIFNLLPVGILDGHKIFTWDKKIWTLSFVISLAVTVTSYYIYTH
jgi:Zn-dependent protease